MTFEVWKDFETKFGNLKILECGDVLNVQLSSSASHDILVFMNNRSLSTLNLNQSLISRASIIANRINNVCSFFSLVNPLNLNIISLLENSGRVLDELYNLFNVSESSFY